MMLYSKLHLFQSALPVWGATQPPVHSASGLPFQSALPVWGATLCTAKVKRERLVSIRAPRVGSDIQSRQADWNKNGFNPRSPCGERHHFASIFCYPFEFQSALPVWGATFAYGHGLVSQPGFNPRSPCGERPARPTAPPFQRCFNPRSPCGERRLSRATVIIRPLFQSALPVWGATFPAPPTKWINMRFNPRSPCGERLVDAKSPVVFRMVSIRAPRVGSDKKSKVQNTVR